MVRLYKLLAVEEPRQDDYLYARETALEALEEPKPNNLPTHMWWSVQESAKAFLDRAEWVDFRFLCLVLSQARHPSMDTAEIVARIELEKIHMDAIFGAWNDPTSQNDRW